MYLDLLSSGEGLDLDFKSVIIIPDNAAWATNFFYQPLFYVSKII